MPNLVRMHQAASIGTGQEVRLPMWAHQLHEFLVIRLLTNPKLSTCYQHWWQTSWLSPPQDQRSGRASQKVQTAFFHSGKIAMCFPWVMYHLSSWYSCHIVPFVKTLESHRFPLPVGGFTLWQVLGHPFGRARISVFLELKAGFHSIDSEMQCHSLHFLSRLWNLALRAENPQLPSVGPFTSETPVGWTLTKRVNCWL